MGREAYRDALTELARRAGWTGVPLQGSPPWEVARAFADGTRVTVVLEDVPEAAVKPELKRLAQRAARDDDDDDAPAARRRRGPPRSPPPQVAPRVRLAALRVDGVDGVDGPGASVPLAEAARDLDDLTDGLATLDETYLHAWQQRKWRDPKAAWREVVLRYRAGSPGTLELRRWLVAALARRLGLAVRLEDHFAISGATVLELGTGLVHLGQEKDLLPRWRVDEVVAAAWRAVPPPALPLEDAADPETSRVVLRALALAVAAQRGLPLTAE